MDNTDRTAGPSAKQADDGKGNRTAAPADKGHARRFPTSSEVEAQVREAQQAVDGKQGEERAWAEAASQACGIGVGRTK